jgi:polyhydroxyalkanoate synthesis regulator protein
MNIVKYKNRKLYNKTDKGYVTIYDITQFIKQGIPVTVTDNVTNYDITSDTLAQCIVQMTIPTEKLVAFIRGTQ